MCWLYVVLTLLFESVKMKAYALLNILTECDDCSLEFSCALCCLYLDCIPIKLAPSS